MNYDERLAFFNRAVDWGCIVTHADNGCDGGAYIVSTHMYKYITHTGKIFLGA